MKALVKYARGPGHMEVREVPDPVPAPDEVVVRVRACGIDKGADLWIVDDKPGMWYEVPVVVGAENCGEVVEVGSQVTNWRAGDRVCSEVIVGACGRCWYCLSGNYLHCKEKQDLGRRLDGAFAEYFKVKARYLHRIPDSVSWEAAVLTEMAAVTAFNLLERTGVLPGDSVAVVGPVGQIAVQMARAAGAGQVMLVGTAADQWRLNLAKELNPGLLAVPDVDEAVATVPDLTRGRGVDVAVDATGHPSGPATCLALVRSAGKIAAVGVPPGEAQVDWFSLVLREITAYGTYAHKWSSWELALELMGRGQVACDRLLTRMYPLEDWTAAFEEVRSSKELIKVALTP
ncbi:MAG TPA: alcohol dehydrogenase catalytic domain-containing protein [Firmicutes bacterium]|nr:alcohol dehydrogenase catalytic domain-containing protein [Bacillota bacterium]